LQDPPKFTKIRIFGLKICHLATLVFSSNGVGKEREKRWGKEIAKNNK
jgi:hypothetical protein